MDPTAQFNPQQLQMLMAIMGNKQHDATGTGLGVPGADTGGPGLGQSPLEQQAMPGPNQDAYSAMMNPPPMAAPPPPIF